MRFTERIQKLRDEMESQHLDGVLVSSKSNIFYYSGFFGLSTFEREAYCFITKKNAFFITTPLYQHDIKNIDYILQIVSSDTPLTKILGKIVEKEGIKTVGFEDINITVSEYKRLRKTDIELIPFSFDNIRSFKKNEEIKKIKEACAIGDDVFKNVLGKIKNGISELELASDMEIEMRRLSCLPSFPTIVAFGKNAAVPHHFSGKEKLTKGQFVLLDFGVLFEGYCSDMTRTVFFGKPDKEKIKMYETVKNAQQKAIDYLYKNLGGNQIHASKVDEAAREYIISQGYPNFPHSLGHGIGIDVHESPSLSPNSKDFLEVGMVFSIEPGIYLPEKTGIRIEDLFTIRDNSLDQLTKSPVDLITI